MLSAVGYRTNPAGRFAITAAGSDKLLAVKAGDFAKSPRPAPPSLSKSGSGSTRRTRVEASLRSLLFEGLGQEGLHRLPTPPVRHRIEGCALGLAAARSGGAPRRPEYSLHLRSALQGGAFAIASEDSEDRAHRRYPFAGGFRDGPHRI